METEYLQPEKTDHILFVNIKNSYNCTDKSSVYYRPSIYEATRKYWRLDRKKLDKVNLLIGHVNGIIKEVIIPSKWYLSKDSGYENRYECEGTEINNSTYLGKNILNLIKVGQNPVNYWNIQSYTPTSDCQETSNN